MLHRVVDLDDFPVPCHGGVLSIGNFDGVHRAHMLLLQCMHQLVNAIGGPAVAFIFDPHPVSVLRPEQAPVPLTWVERRSELLHAHGATDVIVARADHRLLNLSADEFFDRVVRRGLGAGAIVEGPNFGFGRGRSGTITTLNRLCDASSIRLEIVDPLIVDGQAVSSSRIRDCLAVGQVETAARLLGRPHRVRGRVGAGAGRGAGLGFATANLQGIDHMVPGDGVYACRTEISGRVWPVAAHVGPAVTFGESARTVEAHLIGFKGDLRDQLLELDFLNRLRGTVRFAGRAELVEQLQLDVEQATALAGREQ